MKETIKKILLKIPTLIKEFMLNEVFEDQKKTNEKIDKLATDLKDIKLDTMKLAICSEEVPLKERIDIGKKYIESGGNGSVKIKVHVLEELYEEQELQKEKESLKC